MRKLTEAEGVARPKRDKAAFQTHIKLNYEHRAVDCRACPTPGACCTDAHFVNVHITRLEAVAIRDTLERTPRLNDDERRAVYIRAREAVRRYGLAAAADTFALTYACPLYAAGAGCLAEAPGHPQGHDPGQRIQAEGPSEADGEADEQEQCQEEQQAQRAQDGILIAVLRGS